MAKKEPGIKKLGANKFLIDIHVKDGPRKRETFEGTVYEARSRIRELRKELEKKQSSESALLTFGEVLDHYWNIHFKYTPRAKSCGGYYRRLKKRFGNTPWQDLTADDFDLWLKDLRRPPKPKTKQKRAPDTIQLNEPERFYRPATLNAHITIAKSAFNFCIRRKLITHNPIRDVKLFPPSNIQRRTISENDFAKIYEALPSHLQPIAAYMYIVPCRRSELTCLRNPESIDLEKKVLHLPDDNAKEDVGRELVIPGILIEYFKNIPNESKWIFYRTEEVEGKKAYHPIDPKGLYQALRRVSLRLNMQPIGTHIFRRSAALNMLRAGTDIKTIQKAGGWAEPDTLIKRYLPLETSDVAREIEKVAMRIKIPTLNQTGGRKVDTSANM